MITTCEELFDTTATKFLCIKLITSLKNFENDFSIVTVHLANDIHCGRHR